MNRNDYFMRGNQGGEGKKRGKRVAENNLEPSGWVNPHRVIYTHSAVGFRLHHESSANINMCRWCGSVAISGFNYLCRCVLCCDTVSADTRLNLIYPCLTFGKGSPATWHSIVASSPGLFDWILGVTWTSGTALQRKKKCYNTYTQIYQNKHII